MTPTLQGRKGVLGKLADWVVQAESGALFGASKIPAVENLACSVHCNQENRAEPGMFMPLFTDSIRSIDTGRMIGRWKFSPTLDLLSLFH